MEGITTNRVSGSNLENMICVQNFGIESSCNEKDEHERLILQWVLRKHYQDVNCIELAHERVWTWMDDRGSRFPFPAGAGNFSLHHRVQNGSGVHPASCQWVPEALSLGVKRPGREADHSPPSSAEVKEWVALYLHSSNTPSWRGAQLKHRDNFTYTTYYLCLLRNWCINLRIQISPNK
jgi:hypothetical protein